MADLRDRLAAQAEHAAGAARAPGPAATLRRARGRRRRRLGGRVALSLLLVAGLGGLTSRLLEGREPASPPQTTTPAQRQAAPLWTAEGAASELMAPRDRTQAAAGDLVVAATGFGPEGRTRAYDPRSGRQRWAHRTGPNAFVVAAGGGLAVAAPQYGPLIGLDLATGEERWRFELAEGQGPESGTIAGDTLFIGTSFPSEGAVDPPIVYALDLASGRERWRAVLDPGTDLQWAAPVVGGGQVLVADTLSHEGSAPTSHLHALDADTGRRRWRADLHAPGQGFFAEGPVVSEGLAYVAATSGMLLAVDTRTGREVWRDQGGFPLVAGVWDGLVIALVGGDRLVGFDAATGARRWQTPVGRGESEQWAVLDGDAVLVTGDGAVVAADAATGAARWRAAVGDAVGPPVAAGERVYVATQDRLVAIDRASGTTVWGSARVRPVAAPLVTSGRVVVATRDGTLLGFAP
jgi:outer membrane protein assembly factor BamB